MHILITGKPRSGKTTLIKKVIPHIKDSCGFFTEEILSKGSRIGFKIKTLGNDEFILARQGYDSKIKVSKYGVDLAAFEEAIKIIQSMIPDKEFVVIDEIGKMEWSSLYFRDFIQSVLESKKTMIATIADKEYSGFKPGVRDFEQIKRKKDTILLRLKRDNFDDILRTVLLAKEALDKDSLRALDDKAKNILKIPENILIENASRGIVDVLKEIKMLPRKACIFAGKGNNGADSLALARHLFNMGVEVDVFLALNKGSFNKEVEFQLQILKRIMGGGRIINLGDLSDLKSVDNIIKSKDLTIDGVFGIGFKPPLDDFYRLLFEVINNNSSRILSADIPSGLCADSGLIDGIAVKADITVSFVSSKTGFFLGEGPEYTGKIFVKDIGISKDALQKL